MGRGAAGARPTAGPEGSKEPGLQKLQESTLEIYFIFGATAKPLKGSTLGVGAIWFTFHNDLPGCPLPGELAGGPEGLRGDVQGTEGPGTQRRRT